MKPAQRREIDWRISRISGKRSVYLGVIRAPKDQAAAIKAAIKRFEITDPEQQRRLVAQPMQE